MKMLHVYASFSRVSIVYWDNWKWYIKRYVTAPNFVNRKRFSEVLCLKLEGWQFILDATSVCALFAAMTKQVNRPLYSTHADHTDFTLSVLKQSPWPWGLDQIAGCRFKGNKYTEQWTNNTRTWQQICRQQESQGYHSCIVFGSSPFQTSIHRLATLTKIFRGFPRYLQRHIRILTTITALRFPSTFCIFTNHNALTIGKGHP